MIPIDGHDMHPPSLENCGDFLGADWDFNEPLSLHYHRILILSPAGKQQVVAPYICYNLDHKCPKVSGTYGKGYKVHTHPLRLTAIDCICMPITPDQLQLLNSKAPFAFVIQNVVDDYFPSDLTTVMHVEHGSMWDSRPCDQQNGWTER